MPGIVMVVSAAVFHLITVTDTFFDAISTASYPKNKTVAFEFVLPVPDSTHYVDHGNGLPPLENSRIILQCFEKAGLI